MQKAFDQLEERVRKAVEAIRILRAENESLRLELAARSAGPSAPAGGEGGGKKGSGAADEKRRVKDLEAQVTRLGEERQEIRVRLGRIVEVLGSLDETAG